MRCGGPRSPPSVSTKNIKFDPLIDIFSVKMTVFWILFFSNSLTRGDDTISTFCLQFNVEIYKNASWREQSPGQLEIITFFGKLPDFWRFASVEPRVSKFSKLFLKIIQFFFYPTMSPQVHYKLSSVLKCENEMVTFAHFTKKVKRKVN